MGLSSLTRLVLAGALACLLSACWMSDKNLIAEKVATTVAFAGTYHGDGEGEQDRLELRADGAKSYVMTNGEGENIPARFLALRASWFLMQYEGRSDEEGSVPFYIYIVVKAVGRDLHFYSSDCDELSGKFKGLKREESTVQTCNFSRLDGLKSAALAYIERVEKGEVTGDPEILKRVDGF